MEKERIVKNFVDSRPDAVGVFGYGSGMFKQESYSDVDKPQIDLMFIVQNLKEWHLNNLDLNRGDYSLMGGAYFNLSSLKRLKGYNNITYLSNVKYDGFQFKYGVIELTDFLRSLKTWDTFFVAGRFHKPTYEIISNRLINNVIDTNIRNALFVGCLLCDKETDFVKLYEVICGLSYLGDIRMRFAENPKKVQNIVKGSISDFVKLYLIEQPYIKFSPNGNVSINHCYLLKHIDELPFDLLQFLINCETDFNNLELVRANIKSYFKNKNKCESYYQIIDGVKTNGIVKSVPYVLAKVNKRFSIK